MKNAPRPLAILCCGLALCAMSTAQTIYKSVEPDGRIVYSDKPPTSGHLEKTMKFANLPASTLPAATSSYVEQLRKSGAGSAAPANAGVTLYSAAWCGYCKRAKAWLGSQGIAYTDVDVDTQAGMAALAQSGGSGGIPVLVVGGQAVTGFSTQAYAAVFANRK